LALPAVTTSALVTIGPNCGIGASRRLSALLLPGQNLALECCDLRAKAAPLRGQDR
jgi:hypothetical protein